VFLQNLCFSKNAVFSIKSRNFFSHLDKIFDGIHLS
jgi:hypothetical protein